MTKAALKVDHATENAKGWYASIVEMLAELDKAEEAGNVNDCESAMQTIQESVLSVMVRDGWRQPGSQAEDGAEEYEILLSTGGPALRIWGTLDKYDSPKTAELQTQDWFKPWSEYRENVKNEVLVRFAQQFYFEG